MFRTRIMPLVAVALFVLPSAVWGQEGPPEHRYFPLKKGHVWTYAGPNDLLVEVKVGAVTPGKNAGDSTYFALETWIDKRLVSKEDVTVAREIISGKAFNCVYRGRVGEQTINPLLCFLRVPMEPPADDAKPDQWTVESKIGMGGKDEETIKGTFVVGKAEVEYLIGKEDVPLNRRKYPNCITVTSEKMTVNAQPIQFKYYFAEGEGLVKQEITVDKQKPVELKLIKFEPAK